MGSTLPQDLCCLRDYVETLLPAGNGFLSFLEKGEWARAEKWKFCSPTFPSRCPSMEPRCPLPPTLRTSGLSPNLPLWRSHLCASPRHRWRLVLSVPLLCGPATQTGEGPTLLWKAGGLHSQGPPCQLPTKCTGPHWGRLWLGPHFLLPRLAPTVSPGARSLPLVSAQVACGPQVRARVTHSHPPQRVRVTPGRASPLSSLPRTAGPLFLRPGCSQGHWGPLRGVGPGAG